jgi:hypothetical protein
MFSRSDRLWFNFLEPNADPKRSGFKLGRYTGFPVGVEFHDRCQVQTWDLATTAGQEAFVDSPASPDETLNGSEWRQTQLTGSTLTIVDTGFPSYLRILTAATDGQGQEMQACLGAGGATRTIYDTSTVEDILFSITLRFVDANNNSATVEQMRFFAGFAAPDTSVLAGVDDYIGFASADGSGLLKLVADQTSGVPVTGASSSVNLVNLNTSNANLVNKWITLTLVARGLNRTSQKGRVYGFVDSHNKRTGAVEHTSTFVDSLNLATNSDVPGAAMCPTIAFNTGEAVAKQLHVAKVVCAAKFKLGA